MAVVVEPCPLWLAERLEPDLARPPLVACDEGRVLHANPAARRWDIDRGMRLAGARLRATSLAIVASDEPGLAQGWLAGARAARLDPLARRRASRPPSCA